MRSWGKYRDNITWENPQIAKEQLRKAFVSLTGMICAVSDLQLQIVSGSVRAYRHTQAHVRTRRQIHTENERKHNQHWGTHAASRRVGTFIASKQAARFFFFYSRMKVTCYLGMEQILSLWFVRHFANLAKKNVVAYTSYSCIRNVSSISCVKVMVQTLRRISDLRGLRWNLPG